MYETKQEEINIKHLWSEAYANNVYKLKKSKKDC